MNAAAPLVRAQTPVRFKTSDRGRVYGDYYAAKNSSRPMILHFHQAHANRYEYPPIAPRLVARGSSCLAIDQRWGGAMFGHDNENGARALAKEAGFTHFERLPIQNPSNQFFALRK
ncbi:MAG: hypothetical protein ACYC92_11200 [Candidatus Acidiferrales bacterium]